MALSAEQAAFEAEAKKPVPIIMYVSSTFSSFTERCNESKVCKGVRSQNFSPKND